MSRRIDDLADSVEKELNELEVLVEDLRAEQKRMKSSLPSEVLPSLLSLNRKSLTPKSINSPKLIKRKENLPLQKVEVQKKSLTPNIPAEPLKEVDVPKNPPEVEENERIFEEEANSDLKEERSENTGDKTKRRPSLAEALWEKMTSPNFNCPLEMKKNDSKTSPHVSNLPESKKGSSHASPALSDQVKESPEVKNTLTSNVTSRNKRCYESEDAEPPAKKQKDSQNSNNSSLDLFASEDEEEKNNINLDGDDSRIHKTATESFVKPLGSSDLVMMKVFPQTAKSPALSLSKFI